MKRRVLTALIVGGLLVGGTPAVTAAPAPPDLTVRTGGAEEVSAAARETLFGSRAPSGLHGGRTSPITVGVVVKAAVAGRVTGVRLYQGNRRTGEKVGAIYSATGRRLARVTFTGKAGSGWRSAKFSRAVSLAAGQKVTVAVYLPRGRSIEADGYDWPARSASIKGVRGVYHRGAGLARPTKVATSTNYYVDLSFRPLDTTGGGDWPDATNTGVVGCPPLQQVSNGDEVRLDKPGQVYENKELMNPAIIRVLAQDVTIRCVKMHGTGYFGIDSEELPDDPAPGVAAVTIDRVDIDCENEPQVIGILAQSATVTRANVYNCDHFLNAGGDNLVIRDNYCHDLTDLEVVHADCIQTLGGNDSMLIEHNSLWSRDTSDILLGQEFGDASNVVINNNRLMSIGDPPPAYLLYLSGTNTVVTNNRFTRRYTYGACTLNTDNPVVWSGNVWDDNGKPLKSCR